MLGKKAHKQKSEEEALIERVDAMMDPKKPDLAPGSTSKSGDQPLDIFAGLKTKPPIEIMDDEEPSEDDDTDSQEPKEEKVEPEIIEEPELTEAVEPESNEPESNDAAEPYSVDEATDSSLLDDPATDKVVDEIIVSDSDNLLSAEDAIASTKPQVEPKKKGIFGKLFG